ncbi:hypothetical protein [Burkholderia sp. WSM2232]|uniref:hypothetical protein n=1 Tax=Burkholderia sp. WSM2232 TaxID=944436 RepID=UPI000405DECF|nr:hypothetical protein [Burkholderia sp. WSM2232]
MADTPSMTSSTAASLGLESLYASRRITDQPPGDTGAFSGASVKAAKPGHADPCAELQRIFSENLFATHEVPVRQLESHGVVLTDKSSYTRKFRAERVATPSFEGGPAKYRLVESSAWFVKLWTALFGSSPKLRAMVAELAARITALNAFHQGVALQGAYVDAYGLVKTNDHATPSMERQSEIVAGAFDYARKSVPDLHLPHWLQSNDQATKWADDRKDSIAWSVLKEVSMSHFTRMRYVGAVALNTRRYSPIDALRSDWHRDIAQSNQSLTLDGEEVVSRPFAGDASAATNDEIEASMQRFVDVATALSNGNQKVFDNILYHVTQVSQNAIYELFAGLQLGPHLALSGADLARTANLTTDFDGSGGLGIEFTQSAVWTEDGASSSGAKIERGSQLMIAARIKLGEQVGLEAYSYRFTTPKGESMNFELTPDGEIRHSGTTDYVTRQ